MRSRKAANEHVAEVARRRLELLTAELAQVSRTLPSGLSEDRSPAETASVVTAAGDRPTEPRTIGLATAESVTVQSARIQSPATESGPAPPRASRTGRHALRPVGFPSRVMGWIHDRLPPTLQGRVQLGSSHLTVVALLVAAALAVTAWWVIRADGGGTVVPAAAAPRLDRSPSLPAVAAGASAAPVAAGKPSPSGTPVIIIDVAGKVRRPGIATLPAGSRVVDALEAAGGARRGVDLTALNLARLLVDGEQIVVGVPPPAGVAAPAASAPGAVASGAPGPLVNLNTATQAELETLPSVGPVTAGAILTWRTDNGAFTSVDELLEVSGIGDVTLAEMAPFVTI